MTTCVSWYQHAIILNFIEAKMMDVMTTTGAIRCGKVRSNNHRQHTNSQLLTGLMPFLSPNQQFQNTVVSPSF